MKRIVSALLALLLGLLTGCSYLPEDIAVAIEEEADKFAEDFKNEVVDAVRDEFLAEVGGNGKDAMPKPKATPVPAEEEEHATEERILTPTIEYRGITYTPYMTVTAEELYEWIPDLERIDTSISGPWTFGSWEEAIYIRVLPWEEARTSPVREPFLSQYTYGDPYADRCLWCLLVEEYGASSNGIYIGDPIESIMETFPEAYADENSFSVYFYDGQVISVDEYKEMRPLATDTNAEKEFEWKYDVYIVYFYIQNGRVDTIGVFNNYAYIFG